MMDKYIAKLAGIKSIGAKGHVMCQSIDLSGGASVALSMLLKDINIARSI